MRRPPPGDSPRVEQGVLVWERPRNTSIEFPVDKRRAFTIGRDASSHIVLPSTFVSRTHARFQYRDGKFLIEDLGSANGTKVNGAPVAVSVVEPGDTIEFGDERLVFRDAGQRAVAAPPSGAGKTVRLALVAIASLVVMGGILMVLRPSPPPSSRPPKADPTAASSSVPATTPGTANPAAPAGASGTTSSPGTATSSATTGLAGTTGSPASGSPAASGESSRVREVLQEARVAGVAPADALYDRGVVALRVGRLRESVDLLAAAVDRDKGNARARKALTDAQAEIQRAAAERLARADALFAKFRFEEAIAQWEQALQLLDPGDARAAVARAGIDRARRARVSGS
jgi:predicted component of type VI protein secretion system